jgi:hypothetical protein
VQRTPGRASSLPWAVCAALLGVLLCFRPAAACNVPVFRYALERWPADPYEVVLFHRGPLSAADQALLARLEKHANLKRANVTRLDGELQTLYEAQKNPELPWLVVRYPAAARNDAVVWAGRLSDGAVRTLLDSPVRRELARRIAAGETAVWLLLECGDRARDDAAAAVLHKRLPQLPKLLRLPALTDDPADRIAADGPPLKIAFSMLRVSRSDPDEQMLVRMLLHSEDDLFDRREPMAFPVFGRGRALWALVGKGITSGNIDEAGAFLVGPCSCQVKRQNPGTDLLLTADWDALIEGRLVKERPAPPLRGIFDLVRAAQDEPEKLLVLPQPADPLPEPERLPVPPRVQPEKEVPIITGPSVRAGRPTDRPVEQPAPAAGNSTLLRNVLFAVAAALALIALYALVLRRKGNW